LPAFLPHEAFTLESALKCYTVTPYYFSYEENNKFEDYIVINHELEEKTLLETVVLETYMDGTLVYKKEVL
jgi:predicted amidohydrolase YtcJ